MTSKNDTKNESGAVDLGQVEQDPSERADDVYARYSAALRFFGQQPSPQVKPPKR